MNNKKNSVYIATSIDGFIADKNGGIEWLDMVENPEQSDMGYFDFMNRIDALVMGRNTYEVVCGFGIEWPYEKPVFVLSNNMKKVREEHDGLVFIVSGKLEKVLKEIHALGHFRLYIDGGNTIQSFLKEDLIDELILTKIPVLLGQGVPLFQDNVQSLEFIMKSCSVHLEQLVQIHYERKKV